MHKNEQKFYRGDKLSLVKFRGTGLLVHNYFYFFASNTQCALVVALSENIKYHSV